MFASKAGYNAGCLASVWRDDGLLVEAFEEGILAAVTELSAHQRIAMIRDGLLIAEVPHPGD